MRSLNMLSELERQRLRNMLSDFKGGELFASVSKACLRGRVFSITKRQSGYCPAEERMLDFDEYGFSGFEDDAEYLWEEESYPALDEAITAVVKSIETGQFLSGKIFVKINGDALLKQKRHLAKLNRLLGLLNLWQNKKLKENRHPTLFNDKTDSAGRALGKAARDRLMAYLNAPSLKAWVDVSNISITPSSTVIDDYSSLFRNAPSEVGGYSETNLPKPEALREVLTLSVARHNCRCDEKIIEIESQIEIQIASGTGVDAGKSPEMK